MSKISSIDENESLFLAEDDVDDMNSIEHMINSVGLKTETKTDYEFKKQLEQSMLRSPGVWKSKGSEKDIEECKSEPTRENITHKWKLLPSRLQAKAEFEDSSTKLMKNQYVKLEPLSKQIFERSEILITDSYAQAVGDMVDKEMQTVLGNKDNKCFQSVTVDEEMFQFQPLTEQNQALDDFLQKHVPRLVNQLKHNELYDIYRDDYKLLKINDEIKIKQSSTNVKLFPTTYQNPLSPKRYVSSHTWHPTIAGVFAVSYATNNNALYKSVKLETPDEEITRSPAKGQYGISFRDDEIALDSWYQSHMKLPDNTYQDDLVYLLNEEFVQRMRIIQVIEYEKTNDIQSQPKINGQDFLNNFVYKSHDYVSSDDDILDQELDEETYFDEELDEPMETYNTADKDQLDDFNSYGKASTLENEYTNSEIYEDKVDHHDSDTESFYNIWGDDEVWQYGKKLRNVVRKIHREFNYKYDREAKEKKLYKFLESQAKSSKKKEKTEDMEKERMKLTKDLFEAGDVLKRVKSSLEMESKYRLHSKTKQYKLLENDEDSIIKRENTQLLDEQSNSVIIWSISDHIFPKLRLESPEEVCCVEFNPRDGNTVVGGLINGQICIWDITGKLEALDSNESNMSEKEKIHYNHLSMHMQWSLDVKFKTRIRPTALTAILESQTSMVTAIKWIHPMTQITNLGKLEIMPDGQFSMQFLSASMDGTIKVWDLNSKPFSMSTQNNTKTVRFEHPKNLNNYLSPLDVYNNRLMPTYTITVKQSDDSIFSHITTMSFETPSLLYKLTSDKPLVIGKRQFEFVPRVPKALNRTIVVGNVMGHFEVVTWNGHNSNENGGNKEDGEHIWGSHVHDGPIVCIKRNQFYPDIHMVCGGFIVSIWSLNHRQDPIWWKRFDNTINSAIWSTFRPLGFRLCFNKSGVLQFWNLMDYTNRPFYTTDIVLGDNLSALSASHSPMGYIDADKITFATGIHEVLNFKKRELISFSNHAGTIVMITIDLSVLEITDIEKIRLVIQKEISRKIELDAWIEKYTQEFGITSENLVENHNYTADKLHADTSSSVHDDYDRANMSQEELERRIRNETYQWYINRKGPTTHLGKMQEKYLEREKQYMIDTFMEKKNINQKEINEYFEDTKEKTYDEGYIEKLRSVAEEKYKLEISNQKIKGFMFDFYSNNVISSDVTQKINQLLGTDFKAEKEKLNEFVKNNTYIIESEKDWDDTIDSAVMLGISISDLLRNPRLMRRQLHVNYTFEENEEEDIFE